MRMVSPEELPPHWELLCLHCTEELSVSEKEIACQLLCEVSDLFSSGADDLESTDLVKHDSKLWMQRLFHPEDYHGESHWRDGITRSDWTLSQCMVVTCCFGHQEGWQYQILCWLLDTQWHHPEGFIPPVLYQWHAGYPGRSTMHWTWESGYWQAQSREDAKIIDFSTGTGLWQLNVLPLSLCNASANCECLSNSILYLDDILVLGQTFYQQIANRNCVRNWSVSITLSAITSRCL